MRRNKTWFIVLIIAVVLVLLNVAVFMRQPPAEQLPEPAAEPEPVTLTVASSTKTVQGGTYGVSFDFPVTNSERVNAQLEAFVEETVQSFEADVASFGPNPFPDRQYTMYGTFDSFTGVDAVYTSFVFLISVDTGGAHPNHTYVTYTFDQRGNALSLTDVLYARYDGAVTLERIAALARTSLEAELGDSASFGWIASGTEPTIENYQDFYLDGADVVLLFEPYAVGPYAWNSRMVRITPELVEPAASPAAEPTTTSTVPSSVDR